MARVAQPATSTERPVPGYATWIRETPQNWDIAKGKWLFREVKDRNHPDEVLLSVTQENGVIPREESAIRVWNPGDDVSGYKLVQPGDFVISLRSFEGGIEWSSTRGIVSPAYVVLRRQQRLVDGYFRHLLKSRPVITTLQVVSTGIRQGKNIGYSEFAEVPLPIPPLPEQRAIANFLDRKTAEIDALLAEKQRLLELLEEKRTALITQAVTKGLDPDVEMKDSGVEWIGVIPNHWDTVRLRVVAKSIQTGPFGSQLHADEYTSGGLPVINPSHLGENRELKPAEDVTVTKAVAGRLSRHRLISEDLVIGRRGDLGRCAVVKANQAGWLCGTGCLRVRFRQDYAVPEYIAYIISGQGTKDWLLLQSVGSTMANINESIVGQIPCPLPPVEEQHSILQFLHETEERLARLMAEVNLAINHLHEYRTALISAAVTGKIDVREEAA